MSSTERIRLAPQTGTAFQLRRGMQLRIIDPQGEQVCDLVAYSSENLTEHLSSGRSIDYNNTIYLGLGDVLYSNRSRPMFTIVGDDVGRHDFLLTPCSAEMFRILRGHQGEHPSCFGNLARHLVPFGVDPDAIPTTFNVFMDVEVLPSGELRFHPPRSRAGDALTLRADLDLIVGATACASEFTNNGRCKPIELEIRSG